MKHLDIKSTYNEKLALVTGGSSGIGLAIARLLADSGARVWLLARDKNRLTEALADIRSRAGERAPHCGLLAVDVADEPHLTSALTHLKSQAGTPDLIINSAGITRPGYFHEIPLEEYRRLMAVNYFGTLQVILHFAPQMIQRGSGQIVNISSLAGMIGVYGYAAYGGSKFAVSGLSEALRAEFKPHGIQVSLVLPPDTDTPMMADENEYKPPIVKELSSTGGFLSPEQVARETLQRVARGQFLILPGRESKMLYLLRNLSGRLQYPLMDFLVSRAARKVAKPAR